MKGLGKIQKIILILILIIIAIMGIYAVVTIVLPNRNKGNIVSEETIKYNYKLYKRDGDLYRDIFHNLKDTLEGNSIDYKEYAEYITELFVIDFYTLNNKISKDDVGGLQYIYGEMKDNFILNATDTIYKYVENNFNNNRNQDLPAVNKVELNSITTSKYKIGEVEYESYVVDLKWEYGSDLGYEESGIFTLIKDNDKLYIVEK